ncbi:MAG: nucleotidyl transferase AbiEii/AbiGii toxin family protein [Acidimicrobiia bacterium]|nr:nucleotidyl transferase AbiEii/AbiGii toxin family protein [Acidimicrobiia bacterium]
MNPSYDGPPLHQAALRQRLRNVARASGGSELRLVRTLANTVVAQMLPAGVVKGGSAINFRGGDSNTRFTTDLDAARPADMTSEEFVDQFGSNLEAGWNGFTATIRPEVVAHPVDVPFDYVMRPYSVKLAYVGRSLCSVAFELGYDEIGATSRPSRAMAASISELFTRLGFPAPREVGVLAAEYQIAQKLHACTTPDARGGNQRAHDLVDIQLLTVLEPVDPVLLDEVGRRVFANRRTSSWPPTVTPFPGWAELYVAAAEGVDVRPLAKAVEWVNAMIAEAVAAGGQRS